jgi:glycosyltransferase involved in cell wall biosynthesis
MKKKSIQTSLIILTRNEIEGVRAVLSKIPKKCVDELFAVDYQSHDGTVEYFKSHKIPVIAQAKPGRSEAFRIGVRHSRGTYLVFFSPDGNENPADIPKLIKMLHKGNDIAVASRFMKDSRNEEDDQIVKFRAWANRAFTMLANLFFGGHVTDSINGYRAITRTAFDRLHLDAEGFAIEYQMSMRAMKLGMSIGEVSTYEGNRIGGQSTSYAISTGFKFIGYLVRELLIGRAF